VQHDLEQLIQENKQLRAEVDQWRAYFKAQPTNHPVAQTPQSQPQAEPVRSAPVVQTQAPLSHAQAQNPGTLPRVSPRTGTRTYTVQAGDTMAAISRKFNVKLDSLVAANPGVDARRLRTGQTVNIP
jgi:LysM repeat protein